MCIYYGDILGLTYEKREHVFPAGLGGKTMLPKGYVSDQANELFSPLELNLMHNSTISIMRTMIGPGKRGSLNSKKASTSEICKFEADDGTIELGYIKVGKPHSIPQVHIDIGKSQFRFISPRDVGDADEVLNQFKDSLSKFSGKFVSIHANELGTSTVIIGVWRDKFYIAYGNSMPDTQFLYNQITLFCQKAKVKDISQRDTHGKFELRLMENPDSCRVYAKIAYNVLAHFRGKDFVQDSRFDKIRNWILGKTDIEDFISLPQGAPNFKHPIFPEHAHFCFFMHRNDKLVAVVCLYGMLLHTFEFSDWNPSLDNFPFPGFLGLICDWKNKQEYTMNDWISQFAQITSNE